MSKDKSRTDITDNNRNKEITPDIILKDTNSENNLNKKNSKRRMYKIYRILITLSMVIFTLLFINEVLVQPYRSQKAVEQANEIYQKPGLNTINTPEKLTVPAPITVPTKQVTETDQGPPRDGNGRLLQFKDLLAMNEEVKGWITIPDTNIDYVVMQSAIEDPEYYLNRNILKEEDKAGSLFLDYKSTIADDSKNIVIHGHNMTSTENMFHFLLDYKNLDYYKAHPTFTFDTIYKTGEWKIFSVFITNGSSEKEKLFDYTINDFTDSSKFLEFVYQLRVRSIYNFDAIDMNENDQLLILSTCSYEIDDYRTVIVARRIRDGEEAPVDTDNVTKNQQTLYPQSWYENYGGEAPEISSFEEALLAGNINWYNPLDTND